MPYVAGGPALYARSLLLLLRTCSTELPAPVGYIPFSYASAFATSSDLVGCAVEKEALRRCRCHDQPFPAAESPRGSAAISRA